MYFCILIVEPMTIANFYGLFILRDDIYMYFNLDNKAKGSIKST